MEKYGMLAAWSLLLRMERLTFLLKRIYPAPIYLFNMCSWEMTHFPSNPTSWSPTPSEIKHKSSVFSTRLLRARRTVENAFGILANRFRVFLAPINLHPTKVEKIVLASVAVHIFLLKENSSDYSDSSVSLSSASSGTESHQLMPLGPKVEGRNCDVDCASDIDDLLQQLWKRSLASWHVSLNYCILRKFWPV